MSKWVFSLTLSITGSSLRDTFTHSDNPRNNKSPFIHLHFKSMVFFIIIIIISILGFATFLHRLTFFLIVTNLKKEKKSLWQRAERCNCVYIINNRLNNLYCNDCNVFRNSKRYIKLTSGRWSKRYIAFSDGLVIVSNHWHGEMC